MKEKIKYLWFLVCTFVITIVLIITNKIIYGIEKIHIADYMPKYDPISEKRIKEESWETVKFNRTISDMKYAIIIGIVLTIIFMFILYKKKVLKKNAISIILSIIMLVVPIIISSFVLSDIYYFTI